MPRIPEEVIERVKSACEIVDLVSQHVQLVKRGQRYFGLCPFHTEKTPSFSVNPDLQIFHCFGCDTGGDAFKFIQEIDRVTFVEAVTFLADRAGITLPTDREGSRESEAADRLYRANELAGKYFSHMLRQADGARALEYLRGRGLSDETIERFSLGYAPGGWSDFLGVAGRRGFEPQILEQAGLALAGRNGHYDRFRNRIVFPILNLSGRAVGFGARAMSDDDQPKYLNSPETAIYHKSRVLYGLNWTREAVRQRDTAIVVEGYMDLLSLVQAGVGNVVASSGTALTQQQCQTLARYARRAVLLFDGDAAGSAAAGRGIEVLLATGLDSRVVSLPTGSDPDSFVRERGAAAIEQAVDDAGTALDFFLDRFAERADLTTVAGKTQAIGALIPLFEHSGESVRRDLMLRQVAQRLEVDEVALRQDLQAAMADRRPRRGGEATQEPPRERLPDPPRREREFLGLLLQHPAYIERTIGHLDPQALTDRRAQQLVAVLFQRCAESAGLDLSLLLSSLEDQGLVSLVSACAMEGFDEEQIERQWRDSLLRFQREDLTRQIDRSRHDLRAAVKACEETEVTRINQSLVRLIHERQDLESTAT